MVREWVIGITFLRSVLGENTMQRVRLGLVN